MEIDMRNIKWLLATGLIVATTAGCVETNGYPTTAYNNGYPTAAYNNGYPVAAYNNYPAAVSNNGYYNNGPYNNGAYNNGTAYRNAQTNPTPADRSARRDYDRDANGDADRDRR
jgi:hypothetical protein